MLACELSVVTACACAKSKRTPLGREPIERRRRRRAAVTAQRIGAQRVDGDQQNVLIGDRMEIGLRRPATAR